MKRWKKKYRTNYILGLKWYRGVILIEHTGLFIKGVFVMTTVAHVIKCTFSPFRAINIVKASPLATATLQHSFHRFALD